MARKYFFLDRSAQSASSLLRGHSSSTRADLMQLEIDERTNEPQKTAEPRRGRVCADYTRKAALQLR
jgi:hypothetical protein